MPLWRNPPAAQAQRLQRRAPGRRLKYRLFRQVYRSSSIVPVDPSKEYG